MTEEQRIARNVRMNEYMKARYARRRAEAVALLGGRCVDCGFAQSLEFDHVDPSQKETHLARLFASASWEKIERELIKCVLRCVSCHAHMTAFQKLQSVNVLY